MLQFLSEIHVIHKSTHLLVALTSTKRQYNHAAQLVKKPKSESWETKLLFFYRKLLSASFYGKFPRPLALWVNARWHIPSLPSGNIWKQNKHRLIVWIWINAYYLILILKWEIVLWEFLGWFSTIFDILKSSFFI